MRTTLDINEALFAEAQALVHAPTKTALVEQALRALVREAASHRLAEAGGTMPDLDITPRRRHA